MKQLKLRLNLSNRFLSVLSLTISMEIFTQWSTDKLFLLSNFQPGGFPAVWSLFSENTLKLETTHSQVYGGMSAFNTVICQILEKKL